MKLLIGLALLSVALALPAIQPISLPEPLVPEISTVFEIPSPELPVFVAYDAPVFQRPDISPLMIPKEVVDALRAMGEAPFNMPEDTVQIVEVVENYVTDGAVADAVIVVDRVQEEPFDAVADNGVNTVHFVDVAENDVAMTEANANYEVIVERISPIDDKVAADPVHFVDDAENVENVSLNADAVNFVDHAVEPAALAEEAPAQVDSVIVVDDVPNSPENASENQIVADPVHFVDEPVPADLEKIVSQVIETDLNNTHDAVKVVDSPIHWPGKRYDNPLLRSMN